MDGDCDSRQRRKKSGNDDNQKVLEELADSIGILRSAEKVENTRSENPQSVKRDADVCQREGASASGWHSVAGAIAARLQPEAFGDGVTVVLLREGELGQHRVEMQIRGAGDEEEVSEKILRALGSILSTGDERKSRDPSDEKSSGGGEV